MVSAPLAQPISPTKIQSKPHLYYLIKNQENKQKSINVKNVPCKCPHRVHSLEANRRPCVVVVEDLSLGLEKKIAQVELSQGLTRPSRRWVRVVRLGGEHGNGRSVMRGPRVMGG